MRFGLSQIATLLAVACFAFAQVPTGSKQVGTVKEIVGDHTFLLHTDSGADLRVSPGTSTKLVRLEPGQTDLKSAAAIAFQDIQANDRVLVRGGAEANGELVPTLIVLMKSSSLEQKREQERSAWQRHGIGGLVKSVDPANKNIVVTIAGFGGSTPVTIHTTEKTVIRRYAPGSVKFEDAKPSVLDAIHPGDQLRARGSRSADGSELTADEIVSGSFRNISGTVQSTNAAEGTVTIMDLSTKRPEVIRISADSQVRKLPEPVAQMLARRLRGPAGNPEGEGTHRPFSPPPGNGTPEGMQGRRPGGDLQQMLTRFPAVSISDLQKGDAVILVATEGLDRHELTAITMLTGVEPILSEPASSRQAATILSPWNLGGGGGEDAGGGPQ